MTVYVDVYHVHDLVTRRSNTGILVMLNNTPIRWISERQKTVEATDVLSNIRGVVRYYGMHKNRVPFYSVYIFQF
jgi:hypothetical protein